MRGGLERRRPAPSSSGEGVEKSRVESTVMATPPMSPTRPKPKGPNSWNCSYVMSSGDGINLLGTLDVDAKRARFVAATGLFGTAYQFVMPRDQIQVLRVPTAKTPYNALELHTKYRQNILCDFDDNKEVFRRCCEVMKLEILPQVRAFPDSPAPSNVFLAPTIRRRSRP